MINGSDSEDRWRDTACLVPVEEVNGSKEACEDGMIAAAGCSIKMVVSPVLPPWQKSLNHPGYKAVADCWLF